MQHLLFDYHAQVRGGSTRALETLKETLQPTLQHQGFFFARAQDVYMSVSREEETLVGHLVIVLQVALSCMTTGEVIALSLRENGDYHSGNVRVSLHKSPVSCGLHVGCGALSDELLYLQ